MHLLITTDTVGGVWTYTQELVTGLLKQGDRVTLVSWGGLPTVEQTRWMRQFSDLDYHPTEYRLEWMQSSQEDIENSRRYLQRLIREVCPDILHLNQYCFGDISADVPRILVAHSDVVSWWQEVYGQEPIDDCWMNWYRGIVKRGIAGADVVVAPSGWMLDAIRRNYGSPAYGLVIYNGRDPACFDSVHTKEQVVLSVGRLWDKGKQTFLVNDLSKEVPVWIAGEAFEPGCKPTTEDAEPAFAKCHFWGRQSQTELRELFARASIYAATSRYEPFGLAPLEAALSKCAIVVNDIPTFRELWGSAACYFKTDDPEDLAKVVRVLRSDSELCRQYGEAAYQRASRMFAADRMVEEYRLLYRNVVAGQVAA